MNSHWFYLASRQGLTFMPAIGSSPKLATGLLSTVSSDIQPSKFEVNMLLVNLAKSGTPPEEGNTRLPCYYWRKKGINTILHYKVIIY